MLMPRVTSVCGIYAIRRVSDGAIYIGQSKDCRVRFNGHRHELRNGKHRNPRLQNAWNAHGELAFVFEVLEACDLAGLTAREQYHLDAARDSGVVVFNAGSAADCPARGRKFGPLSERQKSKIAEALRGRVRSDAHRRNIANSQRGKVISDEAREKMRRAKLGRRVPREQAAKAAAARVGRPHPVNEDARQRLIERNKTMVRTPEMIEKMRAASTGRRLSDEAKQRCAAAAKAYWAKRKEAEVS